MKSHLAILVNNNPVTLPDNLSIDIEDRNPIFNDTEMFSYPFAIPFHGNRWLLKNMDDRNADARPINIEHSPVKIIADGVPFRSGTLEVQPDDDISDALSMNINAGARSFAELIGNLNCRDIPVKDEIIIGEKIGNVLVEVNGHEQVEVNISLDSKKKNKSEVRTLEGPSFQARQVFEPQALGSSYPATCEELPAAVAVQESCRYYNDSKNYIVVPKVKEGKNYINVSAAYGDIDNAGRPATYCNARVCYKHMAADENGETADEIIEQKDCKWEYEDRYPYWVLDAQRPQSGICFYVLYFLDCLFAHLGVAFDKSALMKIEDLKHLCFFTTRCGYDVIPGTDPHANPHHGTFYTQERIDACRDLINADGYQQGSDPLAEKIAALSPGEIETGFFRNINEINNWLWSRGCGCLLSVQSGEAKNYDVINVTTPDGQSINCKVGGKFSYEVIGRDGPYMVEGTVQGIGVKAIIEDYTVQANVLYMKANSENFPAESVSTVLDSLENAFGIKFHYNYESKTVTAYLIRDVLANNGQTLRPFKGDIHSVVPITEKITGVRMHYSAESDNKTKQQNVIDASRGRNLGYSTDFDYIDYPEPGSGDTSTIYDKTYSEFFHTLSSGNKHVYIDRLTGNAYRIKINGEASNANEMKPSLFEVGQWHGVEYGDCSEENEEFVHDLSIDFTPVSFNDVNYYHERERFIGSRSYTDTVSGNVYTVSASQDLPVLSAFADVDMEHEFIPFELNLLLPTLMCDVYLTMSLCSAESYDPTSTDDGNSPLQDDDMWGFSLAMMRGAGADASVVPYDYNYDGFGNSKFRTEVGRYALASDSINAFGGVFDYNGVQPGVGSGEKFSLKIRAFKEPAWMTKPQYKDVSLCQNDKKDALGNTIKIRSRGLFDTFMFPYAYFLVNRKKLRIRCTTTVAQIADIPNHWDKWWNIDGVRCIIDSVNTNINVATGLGEVELTVYAL